MAEVALHEYCEEVKELIRSDSYDQAIIICRHILEHFPRHVTSYRLLGEASLEKGDYVEAANLFKRVLSVDLEDVIGYVGLGIIYDEQGALEEAIWQLERAFELTPGNAEIRGELQRLYSERDATAPPRLKLTPAALGRLYLKEELYQRAVDEFKGVLEEDPERADIQVALAEALWWSDKRREAAEVCEDILKKFPNCLKANLILGEILSSSGREGEGQTLLRASQAMDPENLVAQKLFRDRSPLPFEAVYVRRLEEVELEEQAKQISPEMPQPEAEPEKEAPLSAADEELEEEMPDWLRELREVEKQPTGEEEVIRAQPEEMPDWLRELEEGVPGEPEEVTAPVEEGFPTAEEEMPTWLHELEEVSEAPAAEEISLPPAEEVEEAPPEVTVEEGPEEKERKPTWAELDSESPVIAALEEEFPTVEEEEVEISEETMARLRETMPDESASIEEIMAWMERSRTIIAEEKAPTDISEAIAEEIEALPKEVEEIPPLPEGAPDWLRELRAEALEEEVLIPPEEVEVPLEEAAAPSEVEIPDWLRELRAEGVEEEVTTPSEEFEAVEEVEAPLEAEIPDWLRELRAEAVEEEVITPIEEAEAVEEVEIPLEAEVPDWLRELGAEALEEEVITPIEEVEAVEEVEVPFEAEIPDWLRELRAEALEEEVIVPAEEIEVPAEEEIPAWGRERRAETLEEEVMAPPEEVEALVEEIAVHVEEEELVPEEEAEPVLEEVIPPAFVEEPSLIEIVPVEEGVAEVAPAAEDMEEEVTEAIDVTRTIEDYLSHLISNPQDHEARLDLARAYSKERDLDQAAFHYSEIVSSGSILDEVIDDLEAAADDAPDHLPTHELLADAYMKDGRLQKALDKYRWLRVKLAD